MGKVKAWLMEMQSEANWLITQAELGKFSINAARKIFLEQYPNQQRIFDEVWAEFEEEKDDDED